MTQEFNCPISGQRMCHPCPVHACPANLADKNPDNSCAYMLPDLSYATLGEAMGMDAAEIKQMSHNQTSELGYLLRDLRDAQQTVNPNSCARCGYVVPCSSRSVCGERELACKEILVKSGGQGGVSLKPAHLWPAVLSNRAGFLTPAQRATLLELASSKHVKEQT